MKHLSIKPAALALAVLLTAVACQGAAPTDAPPTDAAPTDAAPTATSAAPTDAAPTDAAPTDAAPTDAAPTEPGEPDTTIFFGTGATEAEAYLVPFLTLGREVLAEEGISLEYIALSSDQAVQAAIDRGRVDAALQSAIGFNRAKSAGLAGTFITGLQQHNPFVLVVRSDVTELSQLEGRRVGIEDPTSLSVTVAVEMIRRQGNLEPETNYELVALSGSANRAAALEAGTLDAAVLFRAVGAGLEETGNFRIAGGLWDVLDPMMWEGLMASDAFLQKPELATSFAKAVIETSNRFYAGDPAEMAALKDQYPETQPLDLDGLIGDYQLWQEIKLFPENGGADQAAWDGITSFLVEAGQLEEGQVVPYAEAIDPSFVEAASGN